MERSFAALCVCSKREVNYLTELDSSVIYGFDPLTYAFALKIPKNGSDEYGFMSRIGLDMSQILGCGMDIYLSYLSDWQLDW